MSLMKQTRRLLAAITPKAWLMVGLQDTEAVHIQADEEQVRMGCTRMEWEFGYRFGLSRSHSVLVLYKYDEPCSGLMS